MLLRTSYLLLSASVLVLLGGGDVADGRRLLDPRSLVENNLLVVDKDVITQPNLFEFEEEHQSTTIRLMAEGKKKKSKNSKAMTKKKKKTPAASIDVFKNIDPTRFEWVNSDNIETGATTCGFLHTPLGAEPGVNYPIIKVYICVKFAINQPAPSGNIVMHCGGPSSASDCGINNMGKETFIGMENAANYNIIGIDQRGLGRSWPSFYHKECNFIAGEDDVPDYDGKYSEPVDKSDDGKFSAAAIQEFLDGRKNNVARCWGCTDCGYQFNDWEQPDGDVRSFHFLEYSGTRQLAEDLDRFRMLIEAPALSLYGISYGTTVMATYATIFPNNVDKFVLDGNVSPYSTSEEVSRSNAVGFQLRYDYLKYTCWAARLKNRDSCPVEPDNIAKCAVNAAYLIGFIKFILKYSDSLTEEELNELPISVSDIPDNIKEFATKNSNASPIDFLLFVITKDPSTTLGKVCSTNDADWDTVNEFIKIFVPPQKGGIGLDSIDCDNYDQPSDYTHGICFDPSNGAPTLLVRGQDYSGGVSAYNDDVFINHVLAFQDEYGTEYIIPIHVYVSELSNNYYWPKNVPLPIRGSPLVIGIIAGQLYDRATPYTWTSEMREHFPSTSLLTSQSISHGLNNDGKPYGPCQKYVTKYLETGVIDWTDGTVCGEQFPYFGGEIRK